MTRRAPSRARRARAWRASPTCAPARSAATRVRGATIGGSSEKNGGVLVRRMIAGVSVVYSLGAGDLAVLGVEIAPASAVWNGPIESFA